ncbi:MAG: SMC-Scp complex subunit ScpB [Candidatus Bathyarchaeia archaeon]|nr:SMC-Scp complex subunit ScpB [Candidatus Bathyarchaeota archaeon]
MDERPIDEREAMAAMEAGLYAAGRPLGLDVLSSIAGVKSRSEAMNLVRKLKERYESLGSALQIVELTDGRFMMQLRGDYVPKVRRLVNRRLLSKGPLRTLAFIAYRQPVTQAYVSKVRGRQAYMHIRKLADMGLISEERLGNTKILKTTEAFADYFNLSHNPSVMKQQLKRLFDAAAEAGCGTAKRL